MLKEGLDLKVLSIGVYYRNNAPGGMASVAASYAKCFSAFHYISSWRGGSKFKKVAYLICALTQFLVYMCFNFKLKIVHIHTAAHASFYRKQLFIKLSKIFHKKVALHVHASQFKVFFSEAKNKESIITTLQLCDKIIVLSPSWKQYFISIGVDADRLFILNNIVHKPTIELALGSTTKPIKFLFLGEIGNRKGIFDLLNVVAQNRAQYRGELEIMVGGNGETDRLENFIVENELQGIVNFLGWVSNEKKQKALLESDVFILPSYNEGLPIAILEAMSFGKPIISTDVGGIAEVVQNSVNGCLIQPGDYNAIKISLDLFVKTPCLTDEYGKNSLKMVSDYYAENVMKKLSFLYSSMLE